MPLQRDRRFMKKAIIDRTGRELSKRTSNRPPTTAGSARASPTAARAPSGSHVSAWRKRRTRPCAARAPERRHVGHEAGDLDGPVAAASVHEHDLGLRKARAKIGEKALEIGRFLEGGNDDADGNGRRCAD